jgi:acyl transferase domain-containing protein
MRDRDIAIIGLSCRVPGAATADQFWANLVCGQESIATYGLEELLHDGVPAELLNDPRFVRAGAILDDAGSFDESVFGFTPSEAAGMDPQQRIFLEIVLEALENAGYVISSRRCPIGIYAGMGTSEIATQPASTPDGHYSAFHRAIGREKDFLATIAAYKLNLTGPAVNIQTACSTSLVAVHFACQGLIGGDCAIALAGGVSIGVPGKKGYLYEPGGILSPDGHCRAFDALAEGTIPGSGAGAVVLKLLPDALADGDNVYAVIKGSAINNDGSLKVGYTAPGADGQRRVIRAAQLAAEVEAESISYVEAHGTATPIGDPIEVMALSEAFRVTTRKKSFCGLGSVKTNIGHLDAAAGIVGLIKTALALHHRQIPPSLHFQNPNPKLEIESTPFFVVSSLRDWNSPHPLRAGVSSFGIGGTNAHVILEEAPTPRPFPSSDSPQLLVLSARTQHSLDRATQNLLSHLQRHNHLSMPDVAYTLQVGRREYTQRRALVCSTQQEAIQALARTGPHLLEGAKTEKTVRSIIFVFPGQGSQRVGMGKELYQQEPVFARTVDDCSEMLKKKIGLDLRDVMYPHRTKEGWAEARLGDMQTAQSAMFVIEYALAKLWMTWGIRPDAMIGHSLGEYTAACLAGVMSENDALRLVAARSGMMQEQIPGHMLAVELSQDAVQRYLTEGVWLAAVNGPNQCVLSGAEQQICELHSHFKIKGITCHLLRIPRASHSGLMEPMVTSFCNIAKTAQLKPPQLRYISNVTGSWITEQQATSAEYWGQHLLRTVRFWKGLETIFEDIPDCIFLEVSPEESLGNIIRQQKKALVVPSLPKMRSSEGELVSLMKAAGKLWIHGATLDWTGIHKEKRRRIPLPAYPFEKHHYSSPHASRTQPVATSLTKNPDISHWFYAPVWRQAPNIKTESQPPESDWLIFAHGNALETSLERQIRRNGQKIWFVRPGQEFSASENVFTVHPDNPQDYTSVIGKLACQSSFPKLIIYLWSTPGQLIPGTIDAQHFIRLLFLVQALSARRGRDPVRLAVITADAQAVTGQEMLSPAAASTIGICRVISQECPSIQCKYIDISASELYLEKYSTTVNMILSEFAGDFDYELTAYRGQIRWKQGFEKVPLTATTKPALQLREGGVYLITGGTGRIGFEVATYLARSVKPKLVLMHRKNASTEVGWLDFQAATLYNAAPELAKARALQDLGAEVVLAAGDVSNPEDLKRVLDRTHRKFGQINGVFHAAAELQATNLKPMAQLTLSDCESQFRAKMEGVKALAEALADEGLDFLFLFSSLSAILGEVRYAAYSGANAFLDSFSDFCRQHRSINCISVNWEAWNFDGPVANGVADGSIKALSMQPPEGIQALHRIFQLSQLPTRIVVSTGDLNLRITKWLNGAREHGDEPGSGNIHSISPRQPTAEVHLDRANVTSLYVAPRNALESALCELWEQLLGISGIGIYDEFNELGGNSLLGMKMCARIRKMLDCEFTIVNLYHAPTIAGISESIAEMLIDQAGPEQIQAVRSSQ